VRIARIFAYFYWFWADFCFSKTPLNIAEYLKLTKKEPGQTASWICAVNTREKSARYGLTHTQDFCATLLQTGKTGQQPANTGAGSGWER
jgi:hypothetical protein